MPQDVGCKFFNEYKLCYQTLRRGGAKSGPRKIITVHKQFIFNNEHFSSQMPAEILDTFYVYTWLLSSIVTCYMLQDNSIHATRASLPPHLSCFMNLVNELLLVWYIGSHRKKLWNQTLENFWENANLIFLMQKIDLFLQVLTLLFALVPYFWLFGLN